MSRPTLSATALAARMNARPLPEDCDGGMWFAFDGLACDRCESCDCSLAQENAVTCGAVDLCLPCALADCERAEAAHRAADPHCTCNDCMAHTIATTERTD